MMINDLLPIANFVMIVVAIGVYVGTMRASVNELERKMSRIENAYTILTRQITDVTARLARIEALIRDHNGIKEYNP